MTMENVTQIRSLARDAHGNDRAMGRKDKVKVKDQPPAERPDKAAPDGEAAPKLRAKREELRFRVTPEFRRRFKAAARSLDVKKSAFLETLFEAWSAKQDASPPASPPPATPVRPSARAGRGTA